MLQMTFSFEYMLYSLNFIHCRILTNTMPAVQNLQLKKKKKKYHIQGKFHHILCVTPSKWMIAGHFSQLKILPSVILYCLLCDLRVLLSSYLAASAVAHSLKLCLKASSLSLNSLLLTVADETGVWHLLFNESF